MATYSEKTFNLDFELTFGDLVASQFPPIDWAVKAQVEMLFPAYRREQLKLDAAKGQRSKLIEIEGFKLRTPDNSHDLFVNTKLLIEGGKRAAIFGINGSGKTSLFNAISSGQVSEFPKYINCHHMKELEHNVHGDAVSVLDTVLNSHTFRRVLLAMEPHLKQLAAAETSEARKEALLENYEYVVKCKGGCHGEHGEEHAKSMLRVLGFDETGDKAPLSSLSGGLRMRVALASAFFIEADMLLLDEPTNVSCH